MRVAGLFAGIGGFELGLHQSGHSASLLCEILPAAQAVLRRRFPLVQLAEDVTKLESLGKDIDLVCAGFPCQDLSQAGRTRGLDGDRSGLVEEVFRLLKAGRRKPVPWLVIENVPFMLQLRGGAAMRAIVDRLERMGYRWAYRVVDTYSFGLPQRRERVFLVASTDGDPADVLLVDDNPLERPVSCVGQLAHGFYWTEGKGGLGWAVDSVPTLKNGSTIGIPSPPAILMPNGALVTPDIRDAERLHGFEPVHGEPWTEPAAAVGRSSRWGLVGSAVSVPVSAWIGRRLSEPGQYNVIRDTEFPVSGRMPSAARFDGERRHGVRISCDPVGERPAHLADFLQHPGKPLSIKAAVGFRKRTYLAKLKFAPGFLEAVERHIVSQGGLVPPRPESPQLELAA